LQASGSQDRSCERSWPGDYWRLWAATTVSRFGSQFSLLAVPLTAVVLLEMSPFQMGLLQAAQTLPALVVGLFAGVWVDRLRRRPILVATDLGRAVLFGSIPVLALLGGLSVGYLLGAVFLAGVLTIVFDVAYESFLPSLVRREELVAANARLATSAQVAFVTGPGAAGVAVQLLTAPVAIVFDALSFLVSAFFVASIRIDEVRPSSAEGRRSLWAEAVEGVRFVVGHPFMRASMLSAALANFGANMSNAVFVLYATQQLGVAPGAIGVVFFGLGLGALGGTAAARRLVGWLGLARFQVVGALVPALGYSCVAVAGGWPNVGLPLLTFGMTLQAFGISALAVTSSSLWQAATPSGFRGRVTATRRLVFWGLSPFGGLLGGALGAVMGLQPTLVVAALIAFTVVLNQLRVVRLIGTLPEVAGLTPAR
jgi:MFS family permease